MNKNIKYAAVFSYIGIIFNIITGFLYTPWLIKSIGNSSYGIYTAALSFTNFFIMDFGVGSAVSKFLCKYYLDKDYNSANTFLITINFIYFIMSLCITIILFILYFFINNIYTTFNYNEIIIFKKIYIYISAYSILSFYFLPQNGILLAKEKFFIIKLLNLLNKIFSVLIIILSIIFNLGVYSLVLGQALSNCVFIFIKYLILKNLNVFNIKITINKVIKSINKNSLIDILSFSGWVTVSQLAMRFIFSITPTILGMLSGSIEIAIFGVAASLEGNVYIIAEGINGLFLPKITKIFSEKNINDNLTSLMIKFGRLQFYITGIIFVIFIIIGKDFVLLWMGNGYEKVYICAIMLILPGLLDHSMQIARTAILVDNKIKYQAIVYIFIALVNIILSFLLSKNYGTVGVCFSIMISYLIRSFMMMYVYNKNLNINMKKFMLETYSKTALLLIVILIIGSLIYYLNPLKNLLKIVITITVIIILYLIIIIKYIMNNYEKNIFFDIIKLLRRIK